MAAHGVVAFAKSRGLDPLEGGAVRALTPMLITGPRGSMTTLMRGELAPGLTGQLLHHRYADGGVKRDSTIVLAEIPESTAYVPALVCRDRGVTESTPAQLPAERWRETKLESEAFNHRYRLLTLAGQEAGWVRELFSPGLISWLEAEAPLGLSFELNQGNLTVSLPGTLEEAEALERLTAAAAEVSARVRRESLEEEADPDLFDESAEIAAIEKALPEVRWNRPPESAQEAVAAYRAVTSRKPKVLLIALFWGLVATAAVMAGGALVLWPVAAAVIAVAVGVAAFSLARYIAAGRYQWDTASVSRVGLEAFVREYARSRNLELRDRWRFHSEHRSLPLPGFADHVLAGEIPGADVEGLFVMFGDAAEMRSLGIEVAVASDRPLASNALVVDLPRPLDREDVDAVELPPEYQCECSEYQLVLWRPIQGNLMRTAEGSDRFRARAGELVRQLILGHKLSS